MVNAKTTTSQEALPLAIATMAAEAEARSKQRALEEDQASCARVDAAMDVLMELRSEEEMAEVTAQMALLLAGYVCPGAKSAMLAEVGHMMLRVGWVRELAESSYGTIEHES